MKEGSGGKKSNEAMWITGQVSFSIFLLKRRQSTVDVCSDDYPESEKVPGDEPKKLASTLSRSVEHKCS